jgi:hypothetical protein
VDFWLCVGRPTTRQLPLIVEMMTIALSTSFWNDDRHQIGTPPRSPRWDPFVPRLDLFERGLQRPDSICGGVENPVGGAFAAVAQRLPRRKSLSNQLNKLRTLDELVVVAASSDLISVRSKTLTSSAARSPRYGSALGSITPSRASLPQNQPERARALSSRHE